MAEEGDLTSPAIGDDYEALFRATYARLVIALAIIADRTHAEDAVQDAFVQALKHWEKVRHYDDPAAWVRRAALNRLANQRRGHARRDRAVDRLGNTTDEATIDPDTAALADLAAALSNLPERERTAVVLHHIVGVPVAEVALELDLPEGTVKSVLSRTRDQLRIALTADEPAAPDPTTGGT